MFVIKAIAYLVAHSKGRLLAKNFLGKNTVAYFSSSISDVEKRFYTIATE